MTINKKNDKTPPTTKELTQAVFDFETYKQSVVSGLISGKPLTGKGGLLEPMIKEFLEAALEAEMKDHLRTEREAGSSNRLNGKVSKKVRTESGELELEYDRDRNSTFEPVTVKKRQHEVAHGFDQQILALYARKHSLSEIKDHLKEMYGVQMSESRISEVVNSVWSRVQAWHERSLPSAYAVLFFDAVHVSIRMSDGVRKVAVYVVYGITIEGKREIVAILPGEGGESATEWSRCIQDLKNRGLEDVMIICTDGLAGLHEVLVEHFPMAQIQRCIVHKLRNCFGLVDSKDIKLVAQQLKKVYMAPNEPAAKRALEDFDAYWKGKYKTIVQLWEKDWNELMACMILSPALRKLTYTTNAIENLNREIRRVTKTKGAWPSGKALLIQLFLSLEATAKSWNKNVHQWASIRRELIDTFGQRYQKHLEA